MTASAAATLALIGAAHATPVTGVHGDFGGHWASTAAPSAIKPDNHNNLLAFTVNGVTYSTGVNDARLTNDGVTFTAGSYQAFTPSTLPAPNANTYIGVGTNWEGQPQTATSTTIPGSTAPLSSYLSDGSKGLDLASAVFNLPAGDIKFPVTISASAAALTGSVPAIVATQMGDPGTSDTFRFVDATGNVVGNAVVVNFSTTPAVGTQSWAFFSAAPPHNYVAVNGGLAGSTRGVRLQSFTLADFGITAANVAQVAGFEQTLSGQSDVAFVAYNNQLVAIQAPDVVVTVGAPPGSLNTGDNADFTVNLTNDGTAVATNVVVNVVLPPGFTFDSATAPAGTTYDSGTGTWTVPALAPQQSLQLPVVAKAGGTGGSFSASATAQNEPSTATTNNAASAPITVAAPPGAPGAASVTAVPALGELSLLSLGALLAGAGVAATRRRRQQS